jgi:hypothetical protein
LPVPPIVEVVVIVWYLLEPLVLPEVLVTGLESL